MIDKYQTHRIYKDQDAFYAHDLLGHLRKMSQEVDYGVWWRDSDREHPVYRVSYVEDSHEAIAVCLGGTPREQVEVLASGMSKEQFDAAMFGWAARCGEPLSLDWVRFQLKDFPPTLDE